MNRAKTVVDGAENSLTNPPVREATLNEAGISPQTDVERTGEASAGASMELHDLTKEYGPVAAVAEASLKVEAGEFVSLLGPSGSGKTTTLLMVAGFATPTSGRILLGGDDITYLPPHRRDIGMVYQHYALFPHMSVLKNVAFPLRMRRVPRKEMRERIEHALAIVRLEGMEDRLPSQLSGGQQQRVALARAIVFKPPLLLMDEPLGALDKKLRDELQIEIKRIQRETRNTVVYVTHDQEEALNMSDRVVVMNQGRIEQIGAPLELYEQPHTKFVADFMGASNIFDVSVAEVVEGRFIRARTDEGTEFELPGHSRSKKGERLQLSIRPERIAICPAASSEPSARPGRVFEADYYGNTQRFQVRLVSGDTLWVVCPSSGRAPIPRGTDVSVSWSREDLWIIPGDTETP